jgi:hypothetical protein
MTRSPRSAWFAVLLALAGLAALFWGPLGTGFLNDDYLFLEESRSRPLSESLARLGALGNYYRPLSRQLYFAALGPVGGAHPLVFHLFNFAVFAGVLALLADLLFAVLPAGAAMCGLLYFAVVPMQRVALQWVSCSQDLLATLFMLASLALHRRGRIGTAALCTLAALASKETAFALPLALVAWDVFVQRSRIPAALRRAAPHAAAVVVWIGVLLLLRARGGLAWTLLDFSPAQFAAGIVHGVQSLLGLDSPADFPAGLASVGPPLLPALCFGALAIWIPTRGRGERNAVPSSAASPAPARGVESASGFITFALAWFAAFALVTGPVAHTWSSYYYMPAAIAGALWVGLAARRIDRWMWLGLVAALLWWHAGASAGRAFAIRDDRWSWTSHLTPFYFERGAELTRTLAGELKRIEPAPAGGTRFFFATLPPWAGFQMGNGALVRALYRDPSLESYFYSEYSDSIAAGRPCRFLFWNGIALERLYPRLAAPWFQVGGDLILLGRPAGARDAFRRGLSEGGDRADLLYWLGWTELWTGRRDAGEAAWRQLGAHDDSLQWSKHLRLAHDALTEGDSLRARRELAQALHFGIGRPEAHAVLGELLAPNQPKYAMLELTVAVWLKPNDWIARRALALALGNAHLDQGAARELEALKPLYPEWREDPLVAQLERRLHGPDSGAPVARFR